MGKNGFYQYRNTTLEQIPQSFAFEDLIIVTQLQTLQAESRETISIQPSTMLGTHNRGYYPIHSRTTSLEIFQEKVEQELIALRASYNTSSFYEGNLNHKDCIAITELKKMEDIIICQSDKGGGGRVIIMLDKGLYY